MIDEFDGEVLDAGLISAAQRVEHYEIAAYGTVAAFAELLGESEHQSLLERNAAGREGNRRETHRAVKRNKRGSKRGASQKKSQKRSPNRGGKRHPSAGREELPKAAVSNYLS